MQNSLLCAVDRLVDALQQVPGTQLRFVANTIEQLCADLRNNNFPISEALDCLESTAQTAVAMASDETDYGPYSRVISRDGPIPCAWEIYESLSNPIPIGRISSFPVLDGTRSSNCIEDFRTNPHLIRYSFPSMRECFAYFGVEQWEAF